MSLHRREKLLRILDALGKWSLVDSFVMILMLVAFNMNLSFPIVSPMVQNPFVLHIWVLPAYGFITLMIGTIVSLALSHIILALDRMVTKKIEETGNTNIQSYTETSSLNSYTSSNSSKTNSSQSQLDGSLDSKGEIKSLIMYCKYNSLRIIVTLILVLTLGTLIFGLISTSFSFSFVGLAGWALELLGEPHERQYSVIDLGTNIKKSAQFPNSFGIVFTTGLYFLVAIIMPLVHVITLIIMWLVPFSFKVQKVLYVTAEVMYAWSCLDVFVISILAAVLQISQVARFMVGDKCDLIDPLVKMFFSEEDLVKGHETCFDVITQLKKGSWLLFAAAVLYTIANLVVSSVSRRAIDAREQSYQSQ